MPLSWEDVLVSVQLQTAALEDATQRRVVKVQRQLNADPGR